MSSLSLQLQKELLRILKQRNSIFFVQVGSNDGTQGDPLHALIAIDKRWKGIFIEPVGFLFERLKRNYGNSDRFIFERKAIASTKCTLEFFYVSEKAKAELGDILPYWYDQLGSFDRRHILKHLDGILEPYIVSETIQSVTLQDIFEMHKVVDIDILHIDAEGYDYKILSTLDFAKYKPVVILYEHKHLSDCEKALAESTLIKNGYVCVLYGGDTLAVTESS